MHYRSVGRSGMRVSEVGFGVWTVSTTMWGISDDAFAIDLLRTALDHGITYFDTADVYGDGRGETMLRDAFAGRRDEIVIGTKFGYDFINHPGPQPGQRERPHDWSPDFLRRACEASLSRLGTDHIDLYQLHNPRMDALQADDLWNTLYELRSEGKIREIGAALGPALKPDRQAEEGIYAVEHRYAIPQIIYNLVEQMLGEAIFPTARTHDVGVICRVPHASGLLEGNYTDKTEFAPGDHRAHRVPTTEARKAWLLDGLKKVERLDFLTQGGERTLGQAALQFVLYEPSMASALPNIYDKDQLIEFASATETPRLTDDEYAQVQRLYASNFGLDSLQVVA